MDLRCLLDGRKVPLVKSADKWVVSLSQLPLLLTDGGSVRGNDSGEGVGYSDYIRMFLFLKSVPEITMRTLDCVEEALHSKHILFQADQCVTKLEIQNKIIVYKNLNYQYPVRKRRNYCIFKFIIYFVTFIYLWNSRVCCDSRIKKSQQN